MAKKNVKYEIIKHFGIISKKKSYQKEVNLISWGGRTPVVDIRNFRIDKDGGKDPLSGVTVEKEDLHALKDILSHINPEVLG